MLENKSDPNAHSMWVYAVCEEDGETGVLFYTVALITEIVLSCCSYLFITFTFREDTVTLS